MLGFIPMKWAVLGGLLKEEICNIDRHCKIAPRKGHCKVHFEDYRQKARTV
jgi:hypothetical protein